MTSNSDPINIFLKNIDRYRFIAHRLGFLMEGYPENSFANVESIFGNDDTLACIDGLEFDIQFTSDHIPVIVHDFETSDIGEKNMSIIKSPYEAVKKIKCGYRKSEYNSSIPWEENKSFYLHTLEEFLRYMADNCGKLGDRIIKIESKYPILKKEDIIALKELLNKYKSLKENIMHISFFPWHLHNLRSLENDERLELTRTEVLVDFSFEKTLASIWDSSIDGISLGVKSERIVGNMEIDSAAKRMSNLIAAFSQNRNALSENWAKQIIEKYRYLGIYTINTEQDILELLSRVSPEFINEYADKLVITSDNPGYFKHL